MVHGSDGGVPCLHGHGGGVPCLHGHDGGVPCLHGHDGRVPCQRTCMSVTHVCTLCRTILREHVEHMSPVNTNNVWEIPCHPHSSARVVLF